MKRRVFGAGLSGSALAWGAGWASFGQPLLSHPRDFAVVLNLRTGRKAALWQPDQASHIQAAPGSTVKCAVAAAALATGITHAERTLHCPGWWDPPAQLGLGRLPCWDPRGHGSLTLSEALAHSCNVHFYQLGWELGSVALWEWLQRFGLGNSPATKTAPSPLLATGQLPGWGVDPWDLLAYTAAIARRGLPLEGEVRIPAISLAEPVWDSLHTGLRLAAFSGTCRGIAPQGIPVAAKSGTILNSRRLGRPTLWAEDFQAWLLAFWPLPDPHWALVLHLHQGKAYEAAIPIARQIIATISLQP
ncbi:MAG: penicillin-binding transpeptidase domain-containing protein [Thermostichus sp. DG02_2_bins_29]